MTILLTNFERVINYAFILVVVALAFYAPILWWEMVQSFHNMEPRPPFLMRLFSLICLGIFVFLYISGLVAFVNYMFFS